MFNSMSGHLFNMATIQASDAIKLGNDVARQLENKPNICTCINCHKWLNHQLPNTWVLWCSKNNHSGEQGDVLIHRKHVKKEGSYGAIEDAKEESEIQCFFEVWPICNECLLSVPKRFLIEEVDLP